MTEPAARAQGTPGLMVTGQVFVGPGSATPGSADPGSTSQAGAAAAASAGEVLALPHPDWLYHHLRVTGPAAEVAAFRAAARGPGAIPWRQDLGPAAEDWFHLLVAPPPPQRRSLSLEGARILTSQLRDAAEVRQRRLAERAAGATGCPLDLHRLLPVPESVLRLGPDHPAARSWLWTAWGTTQALRGVVELPVAGRGRPRPRDPGLLWLGFWAADWTPWRAILALRARWPALGIVVQPRYDDP